MKPNLLLESVSKEPKTTRGKKPTPPAAGPSTAPTIADPLTDPTAAGPSTAPPAAKDDGPLTIRKWVKGNWHSETNTIWERMFGDMTRLTEDKANYKGQQPNPDNIVWDSKAQTVSFLPPDKCIELPEYRGEGIIGDQATIYALGMTLQYILTCEEKKPLEHWAKNACQLTDDAWDLLKAILIDKSCQTYAALKELKWWLIAPNIRASRNKKYYETAARSEFLKLFQANFLASSKFHLNCRTCRNQFVIQFFFSPHLL